ncbi:hypothetical protein EU510_16425 [Pseudoalteromonas sp. FUC4]|uniref:AAA family ATPase n=1 Tax=Pseudoalteromonas sp. FUC4 TaxID=2511201 RepID=UPI0011F400E5|nr:AAA family ATPase [Pseudoalteromonas sp. FUC4]KAA1150668.1 hypothetical protein EU510_16425 [Pseudoalteromonas sp. FUC4]
MLSKISPRLNIKSSLPKHLEALFSSYILWKIQGKPSELNYGEATSTESGELSFTEDELAKLNSYFQSQNLSKENTKHNVLLKAQVEHLQVGCLNIYKACNFKFQDISKSISAERDGGERFLKSIIFTSVMDLIDGFVDACEENFKTLAKGFFINEKFNKTLVSRQLKVLLTFLIEQSRFNDGNKVTHDLVTDITECNSFHKDGPARIIKSFLKDGLHEHIKFEQNTYQVSDSKSYGDYVARATSYSTIFSPNYLVEEELVNYAQNTEGFVSNSQYYVSEEKITDIPENIPLNLLLKGVPGTGKSWSIDQILNKYFSLEVPVTNNEGQILSRLKRINLHSGSTNSSLMQGVSVSAKENGVVYDEKIGLILDFVLTAIKYPSIPFALVLEEIQENNLNELIGDLIYLIEPSKRAKSYDVNPDCNIFEEILRLTNQNSNIHYVTIPNLINGNLVEKRLFLPSNLYFFCTSNYRDDKKVIEDNLLRRFDVLEIYPNYEAIKHVDVSEFLKRFNELIANKIHDIHSDRFIIGHANWMYVEDKESFSQAFLKLLIEFKDIREIDFEILQEIFGQVKIPFDLDIIEYQDYQSLTKYIQNNCGYSFLND